MHLLVIPERHVDTFRDIGEFPAREAKHMLEFVAETAREAGLTDFVIYGWQGVLAPTGTPAEVVDRLNADIGKALADPALRARLSGQGTEPAFTSAADFRAFIAAENKRWGDVVRSANITVD